MFNWQKKENINKERLLKIVLFFFFVGAGAFAVFGGVFWFSRTIDNFFLSQTGSLLDVEAAAEIDSEKPYIEPPVIDAKAALSQISRENSQKIVFEQQKDAVTPIASITKLMTALVALDNYSDLDKEVAISKIAVEQQGEQGALKEGEKFSIKNLLFIALIESSNDAAFALAEIMGPEKFVEAMNQKARSLGMNGTHFSDPSGLSAGSFSTAQNLAILAEHIWERYPFVWQITRTPELRVFTSDGLLHHVLQSTNKLLSEYKDFEIEGGKTGWTIGAQGCFIVVLKNADGSYLTNVVLGSDADRFEEMKKLIDYAKTQK